MVSLQAEFVDGFRRKGDVETEGVGPDWIRSHLSGFWRGGMSRIVGVGSDRFEDEDLGSLTQLSHLRTLEIRHARITDSGMAYVGELKSLTYLKVECNRLSDDWLLHVANLSRLESLTLDSPRITDEGLMHLARLPQLQKLRLRSANVSRDGLNELQARLPKCEISVTNSMRW
jgi:hypothetical protein